MVHASCPLLISGRGTPFWCNADRVIFLLLLHLAAPFLLSFWLPLPCSDHSLRYVRRDIYHIRLLPARVRRLQLVVEVLPLQRDQRGLRHALCHLLFPLTLEPLAYDRFPRLFWLLFHHGIRVLHPHGRRWVHGIVLFLAQDIFVDQSRLA